jgi:hypothetical protein
MSGCRGMLIIHGKVRKTIATGILTRTLSTVSQSLGKNVFMMQMAKRLHFMGCDVLLPRVCGFHWLDKFAGNEYTFIGICMQIVYRTWGDFIAVSGEEEIDILKVLS